jgi:hypothetical protein
MQPEFVIPVLEAPQGGASMLEGERCTASGTP